MGKSFQLTIMAATIVASIVGTTLAIDARYAKSQEVQQQLQNYYEQTLKLRILEIDLKPNPTPADKALRQYLMQELEKMK